MNVDKLQPQEPDANKVWVGDDQLPAEERGIKVLGSPIGTKEYAEEWARRKLEEELQLLDPKVSNRCPSGFVRHSRLRGFQNGAYCRFPGS